MNNIHDAKIRGQTSDDICMYVYVVCSKDCPGFFPYRNKWSEKIFTYIVQCLYKKRKSAECALFFSNWLSFCCCRSLLKEKNGGYIRFGDSPMQFSYLFVLALHNSPSPLALQNSCYGSSCSTREKGLQKEARLLF